MSEERNDPWFLVRLVLVIVMIFCGGGFAIYELVSSKNRAVDFKADIKQRCTAVYRTLDGGNVTSIYRCPDDTKYEITERI